MLAVALISLGVLFFGTVVPHLATGHNDPHDPVSLVWLLAATFLAGVTAVVLSVLIARRVTNPVDGFIAAARAFAAGDHSARPPDLGPPELQDLTGALIAAADEVERAEATRRQLTSEIAHELRTPLSALQAGLEELRDGLVPADPDTLSALHDQATRLTRIVNDLSALAAAESASLELHVQPTNLGRIAALALAAHEGSLLAAGLQVVRDLESGVLVAADPDRVHQMAGNLVTNAELYCRRGDTVTVRVTRRGRSGVLEVSDSGPGFDEEDFPHVFERAWRGSNTSGTQGSGLGLPIVAALARAQDGSVQLSTTPGGGATFSVNLPLVDSLSQSSEGSSSSGSSSSWSSSSESSSSSSSQTSSS
jgi:two-component system sensor histidine kinase BaeS